MIVLPMSAAQIQITVDNQTGHNLYLFVNLFAQYQRLGGTNIHNGILARGASTQITIPANHDPLGSLSVNAFYADSAGGCYTSDISYPIAQDTILLRMQGYQPSKQDVAYPPTIQVLVPRHGVRVPNSLCNVLYKVYVNPGAAAMPFDAP